MNARTDEDVEPDLIVDFASKAIAGEGIKMSTSIEQEIGPVVHYHILNILNCLILSQSLCA